MLFGNTLFAAAAATTTTPSQSNEESVKSNVITTAEPEPIAMTAPAAQPQTAAEPAPVVTPAEGAAAPTEATTPKAQTKTEPATKQEYVAPSSPQEAHDRIETAATSVPAKITKQQQGDLYIFGGKTFGLRQAFTMLGAAFDKQSQSWSITAQRYDNPALCQDTFDAEVERSRKAADATAKREADIQKRIDEAVAKALAEYKSKVEGVKSNVVTPEGMMTVADAQAATKRALQLMLTMLSKTPEPTLDALIKKAYAS